MRPKLEGGEWVRTGEKIRHGRLVGFEFGGICGGGDMFWGEFLVLGRVFFYVFLYFIRFVVRPFQLYALNVPCFVAFRFTRMWRCSLILFTF